MVLGTNERIKLTAGLLNTVSGFSLTAGGVGQLIALSFGLNASSPLGPLALTLIVAIWFAVGLGFHWGARHLLGAAVMSTNQFIAIVVAPLSLLVVGFGLVLWSRYADR